MANPPPPPPPGITRQHLITPGTPTSVPRCCLAPPYAIRDLLYFHGNATTRPLLVLAAWVPAGTLALTLAAHLRPLLQLRCLTAFRRPITR